MAFSTKKIGLALLALIAFAACGFAEFEYLGEYNGSSTTRPAIINLTGPAGLAYQNGTLYVADSPSSTIFVFNSNGTVMDIIGGAGSLRGTFDKPVALMVDGKNLYVADKRQGTVFKFDMVANSADAFVPSKGEGRQPTGIAVDGDNFYVLDSQNDQVARYSYSTKYINGSFLQSGIGSNQISAPSGIAIGNGKIFISDSNNDRVLVFDKNFTNIDTMGRGRGNVSLFRPGGLSYYRGVLYVADTLNNRVVGFGQDGYPIAKLGEKKGMGNYSFSAVSSVLAVDGKLYVSDEGNKRVVVYKIIESQMAGDIRERIKALNSTIAKIETLRGQLTNAGGKAGAFDASSRLSAASAKLNAMEYGSAQETLDSLEEYLTQQNVSINQEIRLALQKRIDGAKATLSLIGNASRGADFDSARNVAKNQIVDTQAKVDKSDWAGAIAAVGKMESSVASLNEKYSAPEQPKANLTNQTAKPPEGQYDKNLIVAYGQALKGRLAALKDSQARRNYSKDFVALDSLVDAGITLAEGGALAQANSTFMAAADQIAKEEKAWDAAVTAAANATLTIEKANKLISDSIAWEKLGANMTSAKEKVSQAQSLLYTDPAKAQLLANDALSEAEKESDRGRMRGFAAGWLGAALLGIVFVGLIVYWLYTKRKGRKVF